MTESRLVRGLSIVLALAGLAACGDGGGGDKGDEGPAPTTPDPTEPPMPGTPEPGTPVPHQVEVDVPDLDGARFAELGDREFETAKNVDPYGGGFIGRDPSFGNGESVPTTAAPGAAVGDSAGAAPPPGGPVGMQAPAPTLPSDGAPDVMREIVEADVVQTEGDILYALNRYRGLLLVDMSQPDSPFVIGRVSFQAQPVDMYLRDGRAYIVMSDYFTYWQFDADADPLGFHGSQILVVDVQTPSAPAVVGSFSVDGEVTDTRIVGDVLYAVSRRNAEYWRYDTYDWEDTTWVMSLSLADPAHIAQVDREEFSGTANIVQVYQDALSIAATDPNYYLVDDANIQETLVTYVDISDPAGQIVVGDGAYVPGTVADKFKMDLHDGHLRVISSNAYWNAQSRDTLTIFDASDPSTLTESAQVELEGPDETQWVEPQATRYAGPALFVNLCWWAQNASSQSCRLDVYDAGDPTAPHKVAGVVVDGPMTHLEVRGDRLLSLGSHPLPAPTYGNRVQIALFDIASLASTTRLAAVDLGDDYSSSTAQGDYKAFKVLDDLDMILLPLSWLEGSGVSQRYRDGAQIVDWTGDTLVERGRIAQQGTVERAVAFKDRVVSISTQQIQVIDATDRSAPVATASLFLVRNVVDVFDIADHEVQLGYDEGDSSFRFFVLPFGEDDLTKSVAELPVDLGASYEMQSGNLVYVVGWNNASGQQEIRAADFSDPMNPRWRGSYLVGTDIEHIWQGGGLYGYTGYYDYYWNPNAGQPLNNQLLAVTTREVNTDAEGRRFYKNFLKIVDLRDPDDLHLAAGSVELPDFGFVNRVTHGDMLYSMHSEPALDADGNPKQYHERWFVDRVDASDPDALALLPKVNVPGQLVDVDDSGHILYTVDYQWDEHGRRRNSLNVLELDGDAAVLKAVLPVGDEIDRARYMDREIWMATHAFPWWGLSADSPDSRQPYTRLTRLQISESGEIAANDEHDVAGYHFDLLDVDGTTLYLASSYPTGLLILDAADIDDPTIVNTARTIGYVSKILRKDDYLYMPMGSYGVRRVQAQ